MNENQPIMIQIESLSAAYENRTVLRDVNLSIYEKDFLGIIGPNGGGKTTLIKTILGLIKPVMGNIQFYRNGQPAESITMGYLPQYNSIDRKFPISVEEVILSGLSGKKHLSVNLAVNIMPKYTQSLNEWDYKVLKKEPSVN